MTDILCDDTRVESTEQSGISCCKTLFASISGYTKTEKGNRQGCLMKITDVRIRKVARDGKMKAVVSITLDGEFVVHDIKVIEGEKGTLYRDAKP